MNVINRHLNQLNGVNKMTRIIKVYKDVMANGLDLNENLHEKTSAILKKKRADEMGNQEINLIKSNSSLNELNLLAIKEATTLLSEGKIIALPTDTIYGIGCLIENDESLNKLYEIKRRDLAKPIAICVHNLNEIYKWSRVTVDKQVLSDLLPGAVTVVFERSKLLNKNLNPSTNLIGIRIPNDRFVHSLTCSASPLALTSANLSSEPSAGCVQEFKKLWPKLDAIFDAGQLTGDPFRLGSTIVDLSVPNRFRILRKGCAIDRVLSILQDKYNFEEFVS